MPKGVTIGILSSSVVIPITAPAFAMIWQQENSGVAGGSFTLGAMRTRTLNTSLDPSGIIVSLAANQFTLANGNYMIEVIAPNFNVGQCKAKLRNITSSTDAIISINSYHGSTTTGASQDGCHIYGLVTVSGGNKTFEVQNQGSTTQNTNGFGRNTNLAVEIYTVVKIWKIL